MFLFIFRSSAGNCPVLSQGIRAMEESKSGKYRLLTDLSWLPESSDWAGLEAVGCVCSTVTRNGAASTDTRFFITSLADINRFSYAVCKHWSMDVIFEEDSSRVRKNMSLPLNLNILRKTALTLCKHADFG